MKTFIESDDYDLPCSYCDSLFCECPDEPDEGCRAIGCRLAVCDGSCIHSVRQRALSAQLERERLERLALKGRAA